MQELKAANQSPFSLDKDWLGQHPPTLLLTQHACRACDVGSSLVAQVACLGLLFATVIILPCAHLLLSAFVS